MAAALGLQKGQDIDISLGKMAKCITAHATQPVQSPDRGRSMDGFDNFSARGRVGGLSRLWNPK